MDTELDIKTIDRHIRDMKKAALTLNRLGDDFPALKRNTARILASIKMLEINVSDIVDI